MNKQARFLAELKEEAKERGAPFRVEEWRGKGSHVMVWIGTKCTTVPNREIDPKTAKKIRKTLGLS